MFARIACCLVVEQEWDFLILREREKKDLVIGLVALTGVSFVALRAE